MDSVQISKRVRGFESSGKFLDTVV